MLTDKKILPKLAAIEKRYSNLMFESIGEIKMEMFETVEHFRTEPDSKKLKWKPVGKGKKWGDKWLSAWFRGDVKLPANLAGKKIFINAKISTEGLFLVNGEYKGVFDENHHCVLMTPTAKKNKKYHIAIEAYAGSIDPQNTVCGVDGEWQYQKKNCRTFNGCFLCLQREDVVAFVFDLMALRQLANSLDKNSLRKGKIVRALNEVYNVVDAIPEEKPEEIWRSKLKAARKIMKPLLNCKNGDTTPQAAIIGHSHLDTAWLWPLAETYRKAARTFSCALNLAEQYPEYIFIQSAPYHAEMVRREYPAIFKKMLEAYKKGQWEPNGAMWIEPDCNLTSGESFVRQLIFGQQFTQKYFNYTSDTLWLPDVFGYSAALPQILKKCNVDFFCTTKLSWNDTNKFPFDTFKWKGIDGTTVISHLNRIHCLPSPETLINQWNDVQNKDIEDRFLTAFGFGDGGGGPQFEMLEIARRIENLEGCPKAKMTTVSDFMNGIRDEMTDLPEWVGELYLELHRGTLTSKAKIKRGNRKLELALREAEFLNVLAVLKGEKYPKKQLHNLWEILLVNQFHDILPGSSISEVNEQAVVDYEKAIAETEKLSASALNSLNSPPYEGGTSRVFPRGGVTKGQGGSQSTTCPESEAARGKKVDCNRLLLANSLSWDRCGEVLIEKIPAGISFENNKIISQQITNIDNKKLTAIKGVEIPACGTTVLKFKKSKQKTVSPFKISAQTITTPFAKIKFDKIGRIVSLIDKKSKREIVKKSSALNSILIGEDVPLNWDNWDIDKDQAQKMEIEKQLESREIISDGPLQLRIRNKYKLGLKSSLIQDVIFHSSSPQIDFETKVDWNEIHAFLKAGFDFDILADSAKHEIQFGHIDRATHQNLPQDYARFEVCTHKWTDVSDNNFGVALLNDCKYGISAQGSSLQLSLLKSGTHPDYTGDPGTHYFTYSLLPHDGNFSVETVVRPAYELNNPVSAAICDANVSSIESLIKIDAPNIIVESIKLSEDGKGITFRVYEAGRMATHASIKFHKNFKKVVETNMLEEAGNEIKIKSGVAKTFFTPFEIKTFVCCRAGIR